MLCDDLSCSHLCRHIKRNFLVEPGRMYHSWLFIFDIAQGAGDDVAHTVDHANPHSGIVSQRQFHSIFRDELRLCGHDRSAGGGLGQLIRGTFFPRLVLDVGDDQLFHEPFDEGGLSRTHRTDHAYINVAACTAGNVLIDRICHSCCTSCRYCTMGMKSIPAVVSCSFVRSFSSMIAPTLVRHRLAISQTFSCSTP